jgi:threonine dehydrogenase-like Zn-dependent dehydrogenase
VSAAAIELPRISRAAVLTEFGKPLEIRELPIPDQIEPGALLVKVAATTVCGSDVHLWTGELEATHPNVPLPIIPGHEFVGEVVAFGAGPRHDSIGTELQLGDRIVWEHEPCGHCRACTVDLEPSICENRRYYMFQRCTEPPFLTGGFSEYCYVFPRSGRLRVPDGVKTEWAAASACALRTVLAGFDRLGRLGHWETVVVQGSGPLGLFAIVAARRAGVKRVIAIGDPANRLALARSYGADETISVTETTAEERTELVREYTDGLGADVSIEVSGGPGAFPEGIDFIRRGGRFLVIGQVGPHRDEIAASVITKKQISIIGSWSAGIAHYWQALELLQASRDEVDWDAMVSGKFALEDATEALQRMHDFKEIKAAIYPGGLGS